MTLKIYYFQNSVLGLFTVLTMTIFFLFSLNEELLRNNNNSKSYSRIKAISTVFFSKLTAKMAYLDLL